LVASFYYKQHNLNQMLDKNRKLTDLIKSIVRWEHTQMTILILFISSIHISTIFQPRFTVFDEHWYVEYAQAILKGVIPATTTAHPPLGKLFIVTGITIFGDNPLGWRFFPVLFGITSIMLFYLICRQLKISKELSLLAALLISTENLSYVQDSVAMLDVFCLTFMLAAFYLYLKGYWKIAGLAIGLATLCKLTGILTLPIILIHWFFTNRTERKKFLTLIILSIFSVFLIMPVFDYITIHQFVNPLDHLRIMLASTSSTTFAAANQAHYDPFGEMVSHPWDWIFHLEILKYIVNPIYMWVMSPTLWILIIPSVIFLTYKSLKQNKNALFALIWFAVTYLIWIPYTLLTDRLTYIYYFYPTTGSVIIGIVMGIGWLIGRKGKMQVPIIGVVLGYMVIHLVSFIITSPGYLWLKIVFSIVSFVWTFCFMSGVRNMTLKTNPRN
jgi:dolichyl-phosphate-mannose-protein mannosyltransferase